MELKLPKSQHRAFAEVAQWNPETRERVLEFLRSEPPALGDLAPKLAEHTGVERDTAARVLSMLKTMYRARVRTASSPSAFASGICESVKGSSDPALQFSAAALEGVRGFLEEGLSQDASLGIAVRGESLLLDQDKTFTEARVLTDFRPLFGEDIEIPPDAGVIVHKLRINYYHAGQEESFWVALDSSDLEKLQSIVDRALQKEASLRQALPSTIRCLR